jgi:predicted nuclease of predicted toxin-antitoxin system
LLFCLDHDVPYSVARMLRSTRHEVITAGDAGLRDAADDDITVWADNLQAVLITLDREFSRRRRRNTIGRHVWLRCAEPEASDLLRDHLDEVIKIVTYRRNVVVTVTRSGVSQHSGWQ